MTAIADRTRFNMGCTERNRNDVDKMPLLVDEEKSERQPMLLLNQRANVTAVTVQSTIGPVRDTLGCGLLKPEQGVRIGASLKFARQTVEVLTHSEMSTNGFSSIRNLCIIHFFPPSWILCAQGLCAGRLRHSAERALFL